MINKESFEPRLRRYLDSRAGDRPPVGLEDRILRTVTSDPRDLATPSLPRQLLGAAALAALAAGLAIGVAAIRSHGFGLLTGPTASSPSTINAISIGTQGGGDWVVTRTIDIGPGFPPQKTSNLLYHTADGGTSWQARLNFTGLYDGMSWAPDGRTGVVWTFEMTTPCGPAARSCTLPSARVVTVWSTTDGGLHWTQHAPKTFGDFALIDFNGANGWVLSMGQMQGQTGELYRTTDAGASWTAVSQVGALSGMSLGGGVWGHTSGVGERNFEFADSKHGWLATGTIARPGDSGLLETTDGGLTWKSATVTPPSPALGAEEMIVGYPILLANGQALLPVFFGHPVDNNVNFSADHHYVYFSSDGGSTWANPRALAANGIQPTGNEWQNFYLDADHWWFTAVNQRTSGEPVAQAGPAVARTTDGGKAWQLFRPKDAPTILQMTFTDADHGWAFATTGSDNTNILLRTTDGGAHWHQVQVP